MICTFVFVLASMSMVDSSMAETPIVHAIDALSFEENHEIYAIVLDRYEPFVKLVKDNIVIWSGIKSGEGPEEIDSPAAKIIRKKDGHFLLMSAKYHLELKFQDESFKIISRKKEFMTLFLTDDLALKSGWRGVHLKKYGYLDHSNPERKILQSINMTLDQGIRVKNQYYFLDAHNLGFYKVDPKTKKMKNVEYPISVLTKWTTERFGTRSSNEVYDLYHKPSGLAGLEDLILVSFVRDSQEPHTLIIFKDGQYLSRRETPGRITGLFKEGDHYRAHFFDAEAQVFYTETIEF